MGRRHVTFGDDHHQRLIPREGRDAAILAIVVNFAFTAWATLTMNGGHTWNLYRWNYPWHELTIGAVGNTLMFFVGCIAVRSSRQIVSPVLPYGTGWQWIDDRSTKRF